MYAKILAPTDGSPCSERATTEAVRLAKALCSEITLLCVVDAYAVMSDGQVNVAAVIDRMRAEARQAVQRGEQEAWCAGVVAHAEVVEGKPVDLIVHRGPEFDLVVMGNHGKGLLRQLVLGSVVQGVLARIDRPVVVVNCKERGSAAAAE